MLRIAKVLKSNGIEGGLLVSAPEFDLSEIKEPVFISFDGLPVPFFIESCSPHGSNKYVIRITDVKNLADAEEMVGRDICIEGEEECDADGTPDFTGWTILCGRRKVGSVTGFEPIPGNLCLYVETKDGERMIPLHEDFIVSADPQKKTLCLNLPEGLL